MPNRKKVTVAVLLTVAILLLVAISFTASRNSATNRSNTAQLNPSLPIPAAIETYSPPTSTPDLNPAPTFALPTAKPPPAAQTFPLDSSASTPNIAWSAESDNSLTIWVGRYSDTPSPAITGSRPVARWNNIRLSTLSLVVSPDGQSLAVLFVEPCIPAPPPPTEAPDPSGPPQIRLPSSETECEGDWPEHIYVIDLKAGKVQSIPDYYNHYPLFEANSYPDFGKLLGWFDNDRFGVALKGGQMVTATKDGSSFIQRTWPGQGQYVSVYGPSLLPDHKTIFAWVNDNFYFRDAPTGAIHKVGNRLDGTWCDYLTPSPDGKLISCQEPEMGKVGNDGRHFELWVQALATDTRNKLSEYGVWDAHLAWSADSSQIAFAYTESIPTADDAWSSEFADKADTNIYLADIASHASHKLTNFTAAHNRDIQWTPGGNLLLSSTASNQNGGFGLIVVSIADGKATTLVSAMQGEELLHPTFFDLDALPGMPLSGFDPDRPTPTPPGR